MVMEHAPRSSEPMIYMRCSILIPKLFQSKWDRSYTVYRDIKEFSTNINVIGLIFHCIPSIQPQNNMPPSPLDGLQDVIIWAHPLVYLHQAINTLQHKGQVWSHQRLNTNYMNLYHDPIVLCPDFIKRDQDHRIIPRRDGNCDVLMCFGLLPYKV